MRILFLTNAFPNRLQPTRGTYNFQLAVALSEKHAVRVLAPVSWLDEWRLGFGEVGRDRRNNTEQLRVDHPRYYYPPGLLRAYYGHFLFWSIRSDAFNAIDEFRPQVIFSYWLHPDGEVAVKLGGRVGVPTVVMSGGSDVLVVAQDPGRRARMAAVVNAAQDVVCVSADLKSQICRLGVSPERVHVVYRGVDTAVFCPGSQAEARQRLHLEQATPTIVWVGRMVPVKGLDVLIDACAQLKAQGLRFRLCLVGDGDEKEALKRRAAQNGLASSDILFAGVVAHHQLADWYRAADVTALPSLSEGVPNVLLESVACGTPFVASDVGGTSEIAESPPDQLVPPGDAMALANALRQYLGAQPEAPRSRARFTWRQSAGAVAEVLQGAVDRDSADRSRMRSVVAAPLPR